MAKFTKQLRQEIVREFAVRHNGQFDPSLFLAEVEAVGSEHRAHSWFEWDTEKALRQHHLWQAREFANGLRVSFQVEEVSRNGPIKVRETEMPFVLSPVDGRRGGGGYLLTNTDDPEHMAEYCRQAATSLRTWWNRYQGALIYSGGAPAAIEKALKALDAVSEDAAQKAA